MAVVGSGETKNVPVKGDSQSSPAFGNNRAAAGEEENLAVGFAAQEPIRAVSDFSAFKRGCEVFPNVAALYKRPS